MRTLQLKINETKLAFENVFNEDYFKFTDNNKSEYEQQPLIWQ